MNGEVCTGCGGLDRHAESCQGPQDSSRPGSPPGREGPAPCPICTLSDGFHDEDVHVARPLPPGTDLYPAWLAEQEAAATLCKCGGRLGGPAVGACRSPRHWDPNELVEPLPI